MRYLYVPKIVQCELTSELAFSYKTVWIILLEHDAQRMAFYMRTVCSHHPSAVMSASESNTATLLRATCTCFSISFAYKAIFTLLLRNKAETHYVTEFIRHEDCERLDDFSALGEV